ncbi:MAG: helix-turn-helix domain-containing protein [Coriobacteriia bacterium]|nr:helix-turn-helix domain-containing protein [Coriobacteriia bacterium]
MSRVGETLHEERTAQGLSIQQVAERINIKPSFVEAIEEAAYDSLPPIGYTKGFIISYATILGLDSAEMVARYQDEVAQHEGRGPLEHARETNRASTDTHDIPWKMVWILVAILVVAGALAWIMSTFVFTDSRIGAPQQTSTSDVVIDAQMPEDEEEEGE